MSTSVSAVLVVGYSYKTVKDLLLLEGEDINEWCDKEGLSAVPQCHDAAIEDYIFGLVSDVSEDYSWSYVHEDGFPENILKLQSDLEKRYVIPPAVFLLCRVC